MSRRPASPSSSSSREPLRRGRAAIHGAVRRSEKRQDPRLPARVPSVLGGACLLTSAILRSPAGSQYRPIRPSSPIRSERRSASADTSTEPASSRGRLARRPSVVTTTAIAAAILTVEQTQVGLRERPAGRSSPSVCRQSTSLRRFRNHRHRTGPHRGTARATARASTGRGSVGRDLAHRLAARRRRDGAYCAQPHRGPPVRRAAPGRAAPVLPSPDAATPVPSVAAPPPEGQLSARRAGRATSW